MKKLVSATQPEVLCNGSPEYPLDVTLQNISVNNIYFSFDGIDNVLNNGIKLSSGQSYTNDHVTRAIHILADVADSELRFEIQEGKR